MCGNKTTYEKRLKCYNCGRIVTFDIPKGTTWRSYCDNSVKSWNQESCPNCGCNEFGEIIEEHQEPFMRSDFDPISLISTYF